MTFSMICDTLSFVREYRYAAFERAMKPAKSFILDNWRGMWYNRYTFGGIAY